MIFHILGILAVQRRALDLQYNRNNVAFSMGIYKYLQHIREVSILERCPFYRSVCIGEFPVLERCPY